MEILSEFRREAVHRTVSNPTSRQEGTHSIEDSGVPCRLEARSLFLLQRQVGNAAVGVLLSQRGSGKTAVASRQATRGLTIQRTPAADAVIARFTNLRGWNLQEERLGAELLRMLPVQASLVGEVFDALPDSDRDDVAVALAEAGNDAQLRAAAIGAESLFQRMVRHLIEGETENDEARAIERLARAWSPTHERLASEPWASSAAVTGALAAQGATIQSQSGGAGDLILDEYSIVMETMPPPTTPEAYLQEMASDLNAAVHSELFDTINTFHRRPHGPGGPAVGDIYHIDIQGPDNGSVMLVESTPDHFIFQTVATREDGTHPEYGSRQFGFECLPGGAVRWYTKGASRPGLTPLSGTIGRHAQEAGWTRMLRGIAATLTSRGGVERAGSFRSWNTHRDDLTASGTRPL